jgi:hypothetical protein
MSQAIVTESKLVAIADAIRSQTGGTTPLTLDQMASEIANISGGGGGGGDNEADIILSGGLSGSSYTNNTISFLRSCAFYYYNGLSEVTLNGITGIGESAFERCSSLVSFTANNLSSLPSCVFSRCSNLETVNMPSVRYIFGSNVFYYCSKVTTLSFPLLERITGTSAFMNCGVINFYAPSVKSIAGGGQTFQECSRLLSLSFPSLSGQIPMNMCKFCYSLQTAYFPNIASVNWSTFVGCSSLQSFIISRASVIGQNAFLNCRSLSIIDLTGDTQFCRLENINAFGGTPMSNSSYLGYFGSIYVPSSRYNTYIASTNWVTYSARITSDPVPTT